MKHKPCLNCKHSVYERYCANCGQRADTHRIGWHYLWHDLPHSIFHLDKGFLYTAKELTFRPGKAVREFLDGKRILHFRPLAYVLILSVIMSLGVFGDLTKSESESSGTRQPTVQVTGGDFSIDGSVINHALSKYFGLLIIVCLPFYALIAWLFHKRERNFVEIMTAFMFTYGHTTWFGILLIIANYVQVDIVAASLFWSWFATSVIYLVWTGATIFTARKLYARTLISIFIFLSGFIVSAIVLTLAIYIYALITQG